MLPSAQLSFEPNIEESLAWSEDFELAIAAGDHVYILVRGPQPLASYEWCAKI